MSRIGRLPVANAADIMLKSMKTSKVTVNCLKELS